jgi:hypothetical protein
VVCGYGLVGRKAELSEIRALSAAEHRHSSPGAISHLSCSWCSLVMERGLREMSAVAEDKLKVYKTDHHIMISRPDALVDLCVA